jgi:hypothetical protein
MHRKALRLVVIRNALASRASSCRAARPFLINKTSITISLDETLAAITRLRAHTAKLERRCTGTYPPVTIPRDQKPLSGRALLGEGGLSTTTQRRVDHDHHQL